MSVTKSRSTHALSHPRWAAYHQPLVSPAVHTGPRFDDRASLGARVCVWSLLVVASLGMWVGLIWTTCKVAALLAPVMPA